MVSHGVRTISRRDAALARQISEAARELGIGTDPTAVQAVQIAVDALMSADVLPFWQAVLGYQQRGEDDLDDSHAPQWWTVADAEGNEVDVATMLGRE